MEYSAEYLYQELDFVKEDRKELLKDLCEKIYAKVSPWRILNIHEGNTGFIIIRFSKAEFISINRENMVRFFENNSDTAATKIHSWKTPADNDRIVISMLTILGWNPQYIEFMKKYNEKSKLETLMDRIQIEVDYHPDSSCVKDLSDNFNSMK
jgi:hypothetical protein